MESNKLDIHVAIETDRLIIFNSINLKIYKEKKLNRSQDYTLILNNNMIIIYSCKELIVYDYNLEEIYNTKKNVLNSYFSDENKYLVVKFKDNNLFYNSLLDLSNFESKLELSYETNLDKYMYFYNSDKNIIYYENLNKLILLSDLKKIDSIDIPKGLRIDNLKFKDVDYITMVQNISESLTKRAYNFKIYDIINKKIVVERKFNSCDNIELLKNYDGSRILLKIESFYDNKNDSYYGKNKLFLFNFDNKAFNEVSIYNGIIHDLKFIPNSNCFIVISGKMPAHVVEYKGNSNAEFMIQCQYCNYLKISPNGQFLAVCGFNSLSGDINIFEIKTRKKIGQCCSSFASFLKWYDSSDKFITGILFKYLKDKHEKKIYNIDGKLLQKELMKDSLLYQLECLDTNIKTQNTSTFKYIDFQNKNKEPSQKITNDMITMFNKKGRYEVNKVNPALGFVNLPKKKKKKANK